MQKRILVVEDEAVIAMELAHNLRDFGFDVIGTANNGEHALALAAEGHPDLVMMDIVIKGPIDGIETVRRMRQASDVPALFLTAYGDEATLTRAKQTAPYGYLLKPYRPDELRAAVGVALHKHELEKQLRESEERFSSAFDRAAIGMALMDGDGRLLQVNQALCELLGYAEDELSRTRLPALLQPNKEKTGRLELERLDAEDRPSLRLETMLVTRGGQPVWAQLNVAAVRDAQRRPLHYIVQFQDMSARKIAEERLYQLAHFDSLTGLSNRATLQDRLDSMIAASRRHALDMAVMHLDLDGFKRVNDSLGHRAGDDLLQQAAFRLKQTVRGEDFVARLGGDEFLVAMGDVGRGEQAGVVAEKIVEALAVPYHIDGREVVVTASVGISMFPGDADTSATLLRNADSAMYHAKELGKNRFCFYRNELTARAIERLNLENALRHALARSELKVFYQPVIKDGRVEAMEALLRWQHPQRGLLLPAEFLPLAEETGLLNGIGVWVLRDACRQMREWQIAGFGLRRVAVNVSFGELLAPGFRSGVERALADSGLDAGCLEIEVTETSIMKDLDHAVETLEALRALGVSISIDDFGTGFSSLSHLTRFSVQCVKIDRQFVGNLPRDRGAVAVVNAIAALGRTLALEVVAEGVESAEQEAFLRGQDIVAMQGYRFARPMPAGEAAAFLRAGMAGGR